MNLINLYNFINSIDLSLEKNIKSYDNSFIDNFMDELKSYILYRNAVESLKKVPKDTVFVVDRFEENYAVCENQSNNQMYDIPSSMIDKSVKEQSFIQLNNGIYKPYQT